MHSIAFRHRWGVIAALAISALLNMVAARSADGAPTVGVDAPVAFVRNFFAAFDRRDIPFMTQQFEEAALIVHDDGVINTVPELMGVIAGAKAWAPRQRELSHFMVEMLSPSVYLVTCKNRVIFDPKTTSRSEYSYTETWVLRSRSGSLKAVHSHYSKITQSEHSEESNQ